MILRDFLKKNYTQFLKLSDPEAVENEPIHLVLGNQSGDMDSVASAIALAFANSESYLYFPILNFSRSDLELRPDIIYVLENLNVDMNSLLFQEDLQVILKCSEESDLQITLVDHNDLAPTQKGLAQFIVGIIDHHVDEKCAYSLLVENQKIIKKAGSTATLVSKWILDFKPEILNGEISFLLLSAILLDTRNLKDVNITKDNDIAMSEVLKTNAAIKIPQNFYEALYDSRSSAASLSPEKLLKRDFKQYKAKNISYGIASLPKGINWTFENRNDWYEASLNMLQIGGLDILCLLGYKGKSLERTFTVFTMDSLLIKNLVKHFKNSSEFQDLMELTSEHPDEGLLFYALTTPHSRKQLQPKLHFSDLQV